MENCGSCLGLRFIFNIALRNHANCNPDSPTSASVEYEEFGPGCGALAESKARGHGPKGSPTKGTSGTLPPFVHVRAVRVLNTALCCRSWKKNSCGGSLFRWGGFDSTVSSHWWVVNAGGYAKPSHHYSWALSATGLVKQWG